MIGRVAFWVGLYVGLVVGYAVTMNCGVDVADIAVLILFTCWKLWGDGLSVSDVDDVKLIDTDEELVIYTDRDGE
jgi:hypothetical protein